jgi:hypothetical protein
MTTTVDFRDLNFAAAEPPDALSRKDLWAIIKDGVLPLRALAGDYAKADNCDQREKIEGEIVEAAMDLIKYDWDAHNERIERVG